jgi:hypothetical protein
VADVSGAVVPGAKVTATNTATGVIAAAETNAAGRYTLPYLISGTYLIEVEQTGFKKFGQEVQVRINDTLELNINLEVGAVTEAVEVRAETPLLSTAESSLGQVIDERRVLELPLFAGNAMDLVHLAPGTVNGTDMRLRKAPFNNAPSQFSTDGSGNYQNEFTIDGVSNTYSDGTSPRVAFSPPQTAIQEFKVQTSAFDASIGHTLGSVVNVSTKSGTNDLHGEAHWWLRNAAFDAPTIFQNRANQKLPVYQDNRYGASAGAPVIIPKLYNGKNKTFWFYAWEANKFGNPQNSTSTVPTAKMRQGDLSELLALGSPYQIYNPFSTRAEGNNFRRDPIPGNIIPQNLLDPMGLKLLSYYPLPNQPGTTDFRNNYFFTGNALEDYWVHMGRVDHAFSDKHRIFVRFHRDFWEEDKNRVFGPDGINGIILNRVNRGISFDDVYIFSPSFLLNFRYGLTQQEFPERRISQGFDLASLGFAPSLVGSVDASLATFPRVQADGLTALSSWESGDGSTASLTHSFTANFTRLAGSHNIRFGPEFRVYREFRNRYQTDISPDLNFDATYTRGPLNTNANPTRGGAIAALLMGIPAGNMTRTASYAEQDKYFALYIHDDWKITQKLTLNLGLRYELETPITERYNRSVKSFAYDQVNPLDAAARANYARNPIPELPVSQFRAMGGLTFVGEDGNRNYWNGEKNNFMPRIGFAYQALPKTVVRGGYGIFYNTIGINLTNSIQTGFSQSTPIQASLDSGLTFQARTENPFPTGLIPPAGAAGGLATNLGQDLTFFQVDRKQPYAQRWTLGLQQEVPAGFVIEAAYVGNRATRLGVERNINATPAQYLATSTTERDQATINFLNATFPNPFAGLNPIYAANTSRAQLLRPYPQFGNIRVSEPIGYSWYHALQSRIEKRFSKGYTVQVSYTWSKAMEATEFLNEQDPTPYEVVAALDRTHRLVGSGIWELPFGRGRHWGSDWHPVTHFVAGGWQIQGVYQRQSGAPLGFGNRIFNGDLDNILLPKDQRSVDRWLNPNAGFNTNGAQQLANNIRKFPLRFSGIRGPNQDRWDFGAIKNFSITERITTQFRAEVFNAMNHPNLFAPATDPTQANFGVITNQDSPRSWQFSLKVTF